MAIRGASQRGEGSGIAHSPFKAKVLQFIQQDPLARHEGYLKTYQCAKREFIWRGMKMDIKKLVRECDICQTVKNETTHPIGLLHPLHIPQQIWTDNSMDVIDGLPKSKSYDTLLVVLIETL